MIIEHKKYIHGKDNGFWDIEDAAEILASSITVHANTSYHELFTRIWIVEAKFYRLGVWLFWKMSMAHYIFCDSRV